MPARFLGGDCNPDSSSGLNPRLPIHNFIAKGVGAMMWFFIFYRMRFVVRFAPLRSRYLIHFLDKMDTSFWWVYLCTVVVRSKKLLRGNISLMMPMVARATHTTDTFDQTCIFILFQHKRTRFDLDEYWFLKMITFCIIT